MKRRARSPEDAASFIGMGKAIEQLRREAGMSQSAFAVKAEVTAAAIGDIERGEAEATWATLRRIAKGLNVNLPDLISLAEEQAPGEGGSRWRQWSSTAPAKRAS